MNVENVDPASVEQALKFAGFCLPYSRLLGCNFAMSTRILIAGILGGVVMFIWNFIAHDLLPIGEMGVREIPNEDAVTDALKSNLHDKVGFYIFPGPGLGPDATRKQKAEGMKKVEEKMATGPAGVLIYHPNRAFNFPKRLGIQFATDVLEALLAVFLLSRTNITSFGGKVGFVLTVGIIAAIATNIPYENWYGFPRVYTLGLMLTEIVGFLVVGIVAALVLGRETATAT
jgi:hypothetical protein